MIELARHIARTLKAQFSKLRKRKRLPVFYHDPDRGVHMIATVDPSEPIPSRETLRLGSPGWLLFQEFPADDAKGDTGVGWKTGPRHVFGPDRDDYVEVYDKVRYVPEKFVEFESEIVTMRDLAERKLRADYKDLGAPPNNIDAAIDHRAGKKKAADS